MYALLASKQGTREWRNRQTRTVQVRVPERVWGFNSPLAHVQAPGETWGLMHSFFVEEIVVDSVVRRHLHYASRESATGTAIIWVTP